MLISWLVEQKTKKAVVSLNKPVKLRFAEVELVVKIVNKKLKAFEPIIQEEFLINNNTLFAQTLLGHKAGDKVKYKAQGKIQKVTILEIYN